MATNSSAFTRRLRIDHPIIQAPMAGSGHAALVIAACEAGALGSLGAAYMTTGQLRDEIRAIRQGTNRPFNVNLFAGGHPERAGFRAGSTAMLELLKRHHAHLGLPEPLMPEWPEDPFQAQLEVLIEERVPVFSFTLGIPGAEQLARVKASGALIVGTATTVREAGLLASAGVDAIVAQGSEAGGHRGTFAEPVERSLIGTMALVPQVVDACRDLPVIASGGVMDGRGIVASLALGASAVQMGTAFLACDEAAIPAAYRALLLSSDAGDAAVTRAFSGRSARGIRNALMSEIEAQGDAVLPFPLQNALTRPLRVAAGKAEDAQRMSLWAGQGLRMARRGGARDLIESLVDEMRRSIDALKSDNLGE